MKKWLIRAINIVKEEYRIARRSVILKKDDIIAFIIAAIAMIAGACILGVFIMHVILWLVGLFW